MLRPKAQMTHSFISVARLTLISLYVKIFLNKGKKISYGHKINKLQQGKRGFYFF